MRPPLVYVLSALSFCSFADDTIDIDRLELRKTVTAWLDAHSIEHVHNLFDVYDEKLYFYGTYMSRARCIGIKRTMLVDDWTFSHQITSALKVTKLDSGTIQCTFDKTLTLKGSTKVVPSYLLLREIGGVYKIVGESDFETDKRVGRSADPGNELSMPDPAEQPAMMIGSDGALIIGVVLAVGTLVFVYVRRGRRREETPVFREASATDVPAAFIPPEPVAPNPYLEIGHNFEAYVIEQFNRPCFKLIRWQGDKSHLGIRPLANSDPDLEYQFSMNGFVRSFAIECKFRSGTTIQFEERHLKAYAAFSRRTGMPVYIVLGVGSEPGDPAELYLIPLKDAKTKMMLRKLWPFRKRSSYFYYDTVGDRLT